jgi:hypothetical protein
MVTLPTAVTQTKQQLLDAFAGGQPQQLAMRNLIETLFTSAVDPVAGVTYLQTLPRSTTAALAAVGNAINTTGKFSGKAVINTTTGAIVTANGALAASTWLALDGTTAHSPV